MRLALVTVEMREKKMRERNTPKFTLITSVYINYKLLLLYDTLKLQVSF